MDDRLIDCHTELKRLRDLQYEYDFNDNNQQSNFYKQKIGRADFNDNNQQSNFYKQKAEHIQNLIKKGVDYIPNF